MLRPGIEASSPLQWKGLVRSAEVHEPLQAHRRSRGQGERFHDHVPPIAPAHIHEYPTFGLPTGSVRGLLSIRICSFFWIVLLYSCRVWKSRLRSGTSSYLPWCSWRSPRTRSRKPARTRFRGSCGSLFVGGSAAVVVLSVCPRSGADRQPADAQRGGNLAVACTSGLSGRRVRGCPVPPVRPRSSERDVYDHPRLVRGSRDASAPC